jgi:hypothetical protein
VSAAGQSDADLSAALLDADVLPGKFKARWP